MRAYSLILSLLLSSAMAFPSIFSRRDEKFAITRCRDQTGVINLVNSTDIEAINQVNSDGQAAIKALRELDLTDEPKQLGSQLAFYRTVGEVTAYVLNDSPCQFGVSRSELDEYMDHLTSYCTGGVLGGALVGQVSTRLRNKLQWKEYGLLSTESFKTVSTILDKEVAEQKWGMTQEACLFEPLRGTCAVLGTC